VKPSNNGIIVKDSGDGHNVEAIQISVRLLANLRAYAPVDDDEFTLTVTRRETVADFIGRFNIPAKLKPVVVINGRPTQPTTSFSEGDQVLVYEPVAGG
jgi:molybdopterin converting factor small subunit